MHLAFTIATIIIVWKWADWKNWQKYHTTMLFAAMGNLLYNFLYYGHYLWLLKNDMLTNSTALEMLYTLIIFPLTVLLFLSNYPNTFKGQILHNIQYIAVYLFLEWVYHRYGRIIYNYGWNMWWSLAWDCMMFPMWALHHKKPLVAYGASIVTVITVLMLFTVDLK